MAEFDWKAVENFCSDSFICEMSLLTAKRIG